MAARAKTFRVVSNRDEIERPRQLHQLQAPADERVAPREPIGVLDSESIAEQGAVKRLLGVQVQLAEVHIALGVGLRGVIRQSFQALLRHGDNAVIL
jgi:hypothetical protein